MSNLEPSHSKIHALYDIGTISEAKACPKCHSVFISEKECEACGFQFHIDQLGEPFGHRSFFSLRDEYHFSSPWAFRFLAIGISTQSSVIQKYQGALERRLKVLMEYFSLGDENEERRRLFLFEAKELIFEYWLTQGKLSRVWRSLELLEGKILYQPLSELLIELDKRVHPKDSLKDLRLVKTWFKGASLGGLLPLTFLIKFLIGSTAVIGASYLALRVLTAS